MGYTAVKFHQKSYSFALVHDSYYYKLSFVQDKETNDSPNKESNVCVVIIEIEKSY